ncbi:MAG: septal ring lytic transglycosylase RlpA family lipoprotein [Candidatus Adlerbacteria bacterium]|nr:septal ring lytic transglycosylase RlpA family lipoprotein [Candidatus Adlerbacteria bacterium]
MHVSRYVALALFALVISGMSAGGARAQIVTASVYSARLDGGPTASGPRYRHAACTLAHKTLPFGTRVQITSASGRSVVAPVTDRGPFVRGRVFDLSGGCARQLGVSGLPRVRYAIMFSPGAASYAYAPKRKRH